MTPCAPPRGRSPVRPLPKFPAVTRDIAVVCGEEITVGALESAIKEGAHGLLKEVKLFDIYRGKGVAEGKKSPWPSTWSSGLTTAPSPPRRPTTM